MAIPSRLTRYLQQRDARYESEAHRPSRCSAETAHRAGVAAHQLAKPVILEDETGHMLMAVLPADAEVELSTLAGLLGPAQPAPVRGESGHAPVRRLPARRRAASGHGLGLETVVERSLTEALPPEEPIYLEAGDHERLLRMSRQQFALLMRPARQERFARPAGPAH